MLESFPLSYHLKLKYPNLFLQNFEKPNNVPDAKDLQYTLVLTKQSALFNAWKEMNRLSNENNIPFRCVTQWATYQTGKINDTLGVKLLNQTQDKQHLMASFFQSSVQNESKSVSTRKRVVRAKKSSA